jgi:hypothetical protein
MGFRKWRSVRFAGSCRQGDGRRFRADPVRDAAVVDFPPIHRNVARRADPEAHLVATDGNHADANILANDDLFAQLARYYEHGLAPC